MHQILCKKNRIINKEQTKYKRRILIKGTSSGIQGTSLHRLEPTTKQKNFQKNKKINKFCHRGLPPGICGARGLFGDLEGMAHKWLIGLGFLFHLIFALSIFDIYFRSPLVHGVPIIIPSFPAPAQRLVLVSGARESMRRVAIEGRF